MHTSYAPDEITYNYIEDCCDDLKNELMNVLGNSGNEEYQQEVYCNAVRALNHISAMLDAMMPEDEDA